MLIHGWYTRRCCPAYAAAKLRPSSWVGQASQSSSLLSTYPQHSLHLSGQNKIAADVRDGRGGSALHCTRHLRHQRLLATSTRQVGPDCLKSAKYIRGPRKRATSSRFVFLKTFICVSSTTAYSLIHPSPGEASSSDVRKKCACIDVICR